MVITIYMNKNVKASFKNFLRIKRVKYKDVIKDMYENETKYDTEKHIPNYAEKEKLSFLCEAEDIAKLKTYWKKDKESFGAFLSRLIYNYMWEHKDDEVPEEKAGGKIVSLYFPAEKWEKFKSMKGDKKTSEYIMEILFNEKGC